MPWTQIANLRGADGVAALTDANITANATTINGNITALTPDADLVVMGTPSGPADRRLHFWDVDWSGAVGVDTLPVWNISTAALTALYDSLPNSSAAITTAIAKAKALGVTLVGRGTYRVDATVDLTADADFRGCVFLANNPAGAVVRVGDPTTILMGLNITVPKVMNVANSVTTWASGTSTAVEVLSLESCHVQFMGAESFKIGIRFNTSLNLGNVYNEFRFYKFIDNHVSIHLKPTGGGGWINENLFIGGKFSHTTNHGTDYAGARHLLIQEFEEPPAASGTATAGTVTTVTTALSPVTVNQYQNYILAITGGTGVGQKRVVSSNTASPNPVFTMSVPWATAPDATFTFTLSDSSNSNNNVWLKPSWEGNASEYFLECSGRENLFLQPRMERFSGVADVLFSGPLARFNEFRAGYGGATAVFTETNGAGGNELKTTHRKRFYGDISTFNANGASSLAIEVLWPDATFATNPDTAYATGIAASRTRWKNPADTEPRVQITNGTSKIEFGVGGVTVPDVGLSRGAADRLTLDTGDMFRVGNVAALPTAVVAYRGYHVRVEGGAGVIDKEFWCRKTTADTYEWVEIGAA